MAANSSADVVSLLERVLQRPQLPAVAREFLLTSLVKLSTRFVDQNERIQVAPALYGMLRQRVVACHSWRADLCNRRPLGTRVSACANVHVATLVVQDMPGLHAV